MKVRNAVEAPLPIRVLSAIIAWPRFSTAQTKTATGTWLEEALSLLAEFLPREIRPATDNSQQHRIFNIRPANTHSFPDLVHKRRQSKAGTYLCLKLWLVGAQ